MDRRRLRKETAYRNAVKGNTVKVATGGRGGTVKCPMNVANGFS